MSLFSWILSEMLFKFLLFPTEWFNNLKKHHKRPQPFLISNYVATSLVLPQLLLSFRSHKHYKITQFSYLQRKRSAVERWWPVQGGGDQASVERGRNQGRSIRLWSIRHPGKTWTSGWCGSVILFYLKILTTRQSRQCKYVSVKSTDHTPCVILRESCSPFTKELRSTIFLEASLLCEYAFLC